ncbi:uncharacterized protein CTRU02_215255 [Colletotrichum truncatum]|uniref:Uncharacterized protein n=1 Tax=Colletotrichum truncatum TaxID=5467 RepID=A0ACC3YDB9_COLTU
MSFIHPSPTEDDASGTKVGNLPGASAARLTCLPYRPGPPPADDIPNKRLKSEASSYREEYQLAIHQSDDKHSRSNICVRPQFYCVSLYAQQSVRYVLPFVPFSVIDKRFSIVPNDRNKPLYGIMSQILKPREAFHMGIVHSLFADDFSWSKFTDLLVEFFPAFDIEKVVISTKLLHNGITLGKGTFGHRGEFFQAIRLMIGATGITQELPQLLGVSIEFELKDGRPLKDNYDKFTLDAIMRDSDNLAWI